MMIFYMIFITSMNNCYLFINNFFIFIQSYHF